MVGGVVFRGVPMPLDTIGLGVLNVPLLVGDCRLGVFRVGVFRVGVLPFFRFRAARVFLTYFCSSRSVGISSLSMSISISSLSSCEVELLLHISTTGLSLLEGSLKMSCFRACFSRLLRGVLSRFFSGALRVPGVRDPARFMPSICFVITIIDFCNCASCCSTMLA